jgi:hypothetical protein
MPTYVTVDDVKKSYVPSKETRKSVTSSVDNTSDITLLVPESDFQRSFSAQAAAIAKQSMGKRNQIVRGTTPKQETFATLEIIKAGESGVTEANPDAGLKIEEFLLQSSQEVTQERYQLIETFGDTVGFFFGQRPKIYNYSGVLMNTEDWPWRDRWKTNYETEVRGTRCVEKSSRAYLTYDYVLREGYLLGMQVNQMSAHPGNVDFSFTMFVTREINLEPDDAGDVKESAEALDNLMEPIYEMQNAIEAINNPRTQIKAKTGDWAAFVTGATSTSYPENSTGRQDIYRNATPAYGPRSTPNPFGSMPTVPGY